MRSCARSPSSSRSRLLTPPRAQFFILPETFVPYILYQETKRLRKETGDERWHAAMESGRETISDVLKRTVGKPFIMIAQEPMLAVITVYSESFSCRPFLRVKNGS